MPKRFFKRKSSKSKTAKIERQVVRIQKYMPRQELKTSTLSNNSFALTNAYAWDNPCDMKQGNANGSRAGNKITVLGMSVKGSWFTTAVNNTFSYVRGTLMLDRVTQGANPVTTEFLIDPATSIRAWCSNFDARCVKYRKGPHMNDRAAIAYQVLWDKSVVLYPYQGAVAGGSAQVASGKDNFEFNINVRCRIPIIYDGNAGTVADIMKNNITWGSFDTAAVGFEQSSITIYYVDNV